MKRIAIFLFCAFAACALNSQETIDVVNKKVQIGEIDSLVTVSSDSAFSDIDMYITEQNDVEDRDTVIENSYTLPLTSVNRNTLVQSIRSQIWNIENQLAAAQEMLRQERSVEKGLLPLNDYLVEETGLDYFGWSNQFLNRFTGVYRLEYDVSGDGTIDLQTESWLIAIRDTTVNNFIEVELNGSGTAYVPVTPGIVGNIFVMGAYRLEIRNISGDIGISPPDPRIKVATSPGSTTYYREEGLVALRRLKDSDQLPVQI